MIASAALSVLLCLSLASAPPAWEQVASSDGIAVFARTREGSAIAEVKAEAVVDAPPEAVWAVVRDYEAQTRTMPYTEAARVLAREAGDKVTVLYTVIKAPLADRRDLTVRITDESQWQGGQGFLKARWTAVEAGPAPVDGIVRVRLNDGYWLLRPREGGARTQVTYYLYTDPGGSVPRWIVNQANRSSLPEVLRALRREVAQRGAAGHGVGAVPHPRPLPGGEGAPAAPKS